MRRMRSPCWARVRSGQIAAVPLSSPTTLRRSISGMKLPRLRVPEVGTDPTFYLKRTFVIGGKAGLGQARIVLMRQTSVPGQTEKNSARAYVFRFAPELGHCRMCSACLKRANTGSQTAVIRPSTDCASRTSQNVCAIAESPPCSASVIVVRRLAGSSWTRLPSDSDSSKQIA
jgi:hypothetical protein